MKMALTVTSPADAVGGAGRRSEGVVPSSGGDGVGDSSSRTKTAKRIRRGTGTLSGPPFAPAVDDFLAGGSRMKMEMAVSDSLSPDLSKSVFMTNR